MKCGESTHDLVTDELSTRYAFSVLRERMRKRGGMVRDFVFGRHKLSPPRPLVEFINEQGHLAMRRADSTECDHFAQQAAEMLARNYDLVVSPEAILPTPGGRAAMSALVNTVLAPGSRVLVTEPGYPAFARLAAYRRARLLSAWLDPLRGFAPALDDLPESDAAQIALAAINYPNNPTGATLSALVVEALRDRIGPEALLFNDATYGPLTYEGTPRSLLGYVTTDAQESVAVELHAFSKLFALGPLGISFLVGPPPLIRKVRDYGDFAWTPLNSLQIGVACLCAGDAGHVSATREWFGDRISRLRATLIKIGLEPYAAPSGMYVLCRAPAAIGGVRCSSARHAAEVLLEQFGIAVAAWDASPHGYLRFSASYEPEDLQALEDLAPELALRKDEG